MIELDKIENVAALKRELDALSKAAIGSGFAVGMRQDDLNRIADKIGRLLATEIGVLPELIICFSVTMSGLLQQVIDGMNAVNEGEKKHHVQ